MFPSIMIYVFKTLSERLKSHHEPTLLSDRDSAKSDGTVFVQTRKFECQSHQT